MFSGRIIVNQMGPESQIIASKTTAILHQIWRNTEIRAIPLETSAALAGSFVFILCDITTARPLDMLQAIATRFLDDASSNDINAVRIRLTEEKSKHLLLQNDVETLMGKVDELERKLKDHGHRKERLRHAQTPVHFNVKLTSPIDVDTLHVIVFDKSWVYLMKLDDMTTPQ